MQKVVSDFQSAATEYHKDPLLKESLQALAPIIEGRTSTAETSAARKALLTILTDTSQQLEQVPQRISLFFDLDKLSEVTAQIMVGLVDLDSTVPPGPLDEEQDETPTSRPPESGPPREVPDSVPLSSAGPTKRTSYVNLQAAKVPTMAPPPSEEVDQLDEINEAAELAQRLDAVLKVGSNEEVRAIAREIQTVLEQEAAAQASSEIERMDRISSPNTDNLENWRISLRIYIETYDGPAGVFEILDQSIHLRMVNKRTVYDSGFREEYLTSTDFTRLLKKAGQVQLKHALESLARDRQAEIRGVDLVKRNEEDEADIQFITADIRARLFDRGNIGMFYIVDQTERHRVLDEVKKATELAQRLDAVLAAGLNEEARTISGKIQVLFAQATTALESSD